MSSIQYNSIEADAILHKLGEELAAMTQERDVLLAEKVRWADRATHYLGTTCENVADLAICQHKLAASQAREAQLREALEDCCSACCSPSDIYHITKEALVLPTDDTALRQYVEDEKYNRWKRAVIDAAVVHWSFKKEHEDDPQGALRDLLCISNQIALDPHISSDADALCRTYGAKLLRDMADNYPSHVDLRRKADELWAEK